MLWGDGVRLHFQRQFHLPSVIQRKTKAGNILYGNVEIVQNVPIGHLIVVLSGDEAQRQQALTYLAKQGVRTNVLKTYQQTKQKQNLKEI